MTEASRTWAMRALDPCDEQAGGGVRIPDLNVDETVAMESRLFNSISSPHSSANWGLQLAMLPFPDCPLAYRTRAEPGLDWGNWVALPLNDIQAQSALPATKVGANLNAARWFDAPSDAGNYTPSTLLRNATSYRLTFAGLTAHLAASTLVNGGNVTGGQWGAAASRTSRDWFATMPIGSGSEAGDNQARIEQSYVDTWLILDAPTEPSQIVQKVPNAGQWEARKGAYMPIRFEDPVHPFTKVQTASKVVGDGPINGTLQPKAVTLPIRIRDWITTSESGTSDNASEYVWNDAGNPLNDDGTIKTGYFVMCSAGPVNQQTGFIMFNGLDKAAPVTVKMRVGLQMVADTKSLWAPFGETTVEVDEGALKKVALVQRQLPLMYEAKYNDVGAILGVIARLAASVLGPMIVGAVSKFGKQLDFAQSR